MTEHENSVSAGIGSDIRVAAVGAMAPFIAGVSILLGYEWLDAFGVILGIAVTIWWAVWWYRRNDESFFPRDVNGSAFAITVVLTVGLLLFVLASM